VAAPERPPEQLIRGWLEEHGIVTVGLSAIEETWGVEELGARERRRIARALDSVGVVVEPSLRKVSRGDKLRLSLRDETSDLGHQTSAVRFWPIAVAIGLMVAGSLGPWAKDIFVTDYGLERNGALVMGAAGLAALVLALHARRGGQSRLPIVAAALGALAIGILASEFRDVLDDTFVEPAWGLYAAATGSVLLVIVSMALLVRRG
jgi:hypothetical protein